MLSSCPENLVVHYYPHCFKNASCPTLKNIFEKHLQTLLLSLC